MKRLMAIVTVFLLVAMLVHTTYGFSLSNILTGGCGILTSSGIQQQLAVSAPWYCPINQQISATWEQWAPVALIAVFIAFSVAGLIFMVGVALRNDKIRTYGVGEIYEAVATALIAIGFMYICAVLFGLWPSVLVGPINPYATAFHLMGETINTTQNYYSALLTMYMAASFINALNVSVNFNCPGTTVCSTFWARLVNFVANRAIPFFNTIRPGIRFALTLLVIMPTNTILAQINGPLNLLYLEYYTLLFFSVASIPVFLVPGIILRSFIPTRAVGGMMIAIAMGFYLVMPTMFAVAYYVTAPQLMQQLNTMTTTINQVNSIPVSQFVLIGPSSPVVSTLRNAGSAMGSFWLLVMLYPMLIVGITFAFITQVGNFIGGSTQLGGKVRMFI